MTRDDYNFSLTDSHIASNNLLLYIHFPAFISSSAGSTSAAPDDRSFR